MKKFILITILIFVMTGAVFAQMTLTDIDDYMQDALINWESPTSAATGGLFTSEADDFIDPSYYTDVEFDKFYAMTSFADDKRVSLGFAKTIGDLYFGLYYGGTFWSGKTPFDYEERKVWWLGNEKNGVRVYDIDTDPLATSNLENEGSILVGAANMGFRLSFFSSYQSFSDTDFINSNGGTDTAVKSAEVAKGDIIPQISWGMAKDLIDNGIRPYLFFQLGFHREYGKYQLYDDLPDYEPTDEQILTSADYVVPVFGLGLGGFTFYTKGEFELSADFDYVLTIVSTGENEYNYTDGDGKNRIKTFKGENDEGSLRELSVNSHSISPSLNGSWSDGNLSFAFRLGLDFGFTKVTFTDLEAYSEYTDGTLVKNGEDGTLSAVFFQPSLGLAAQWQVASKLALNIGGYLAPGTVTRKTKDSSTYTDGKQDEYSSATTVGTTFEGAESRLTLGAKFNPTDNLIFEAVTGAGYNDGSTPNNNNVSVFGTDRATKGLLFFFQLLASVKF